MEHFTLAKGVRRAAIAALLLLSLLPAQAAADSLVIATGYHDDVVETFTKAFKASHPGIAVETIHLSGPDAYAALTDEDSGADIYWGASPRNFAALAEADAFEPIRADRAVLPGHVGAQTLSDPEGRYEAFELAGYGFVIDEMALREKGTARPGNWHDFAKPAYAGHAAMPVPSSVGFAPLLYDTMLRARGWETGWAAIAEAGAEAELIVSGPDSVATVDAGTAAIGLAIDFYARAAMNGNDALSFVYPLPTRFSVAHIAVMKRAPNPEAARAFAAFALSKEGQALLTGPGINRYPVRPDAYGPDADSPFDWPEDALLPDDGKAARERLMLISALFDAMVTDRQEELRSLWRAIREAEEKPGTPEEAERFAKARMLAGFVPVTEAQANDDAFLALFDRSREGETTAETEKLKAAWRDALDDAHGQARALLP